MGRPASGSRNSWRPLWDDMAPRVVFIRSKSPAGLEPRLAKEAATLAREGYEVHAVLWDRERAFRAEERRDGIRIHRYQLLAPEGQPELAALLPRWWWYAFRRVASLRPDVVHAVDFDTIVPGYAAARFAGAKVVYDIFDFYAEMVTADVPPRIRHALTMWERAMIGKADLVILPDLRRKEQFGTVRPKRLAEIMNVPENRGVAGK
ncbi:MAG: glycosyltransferase family 4 protein, partial [Methanobacteriota archaeon]